MTVVLDVSAALEILLRKDKAGLFEKTFQEADWVIAPELYIAEISNVLWKYQKAKALSHEEALRVTENGIALVDDFFGLQDLWKEAQGEGVRSAHSVYDLFYAVLARRNDALLMTSDKELAALCRKLEIQVCSQEES